MTYFDAEKYSEGQEIGAKARLSSFETIAPALYTDSDLIEIMEKPSLAFSNTDKLKVSSIGTARTRDGIIKALIERGQVEKVKIDKVVYLSPTEHGLGVFELLNTIAPEMMSLQIISLWEGKLKEIEQGLHPGEFILSQRDFCSKVSKLIKESNFTVQAVKKRKEERFDIQEKIIDNRRSIFEGGPCPKCKIGVLVTARKKNNEIYAKCSNGRYDSSTKTIIGCNWRNWDNV